MLGKLQSIQAYDFYIFETFSAKQDTDDPLCGLTTAEKLRACSSVLNSSIFKLIVKYKQDYFHFKDSCRRRKVNVRMESGIVSHEEWMLPCYGEYINDDDLSGTKLTQDSVHYLSRSYNSHMLFVYDCSGDTPNCTIFGLSKNISVILDKCQRPFCIK